MRCAVLGEGPAAIFCLNELVSRGWPVACALSPDGTLIEQAKLHGIEHLADRSVFFDRLRSDRVDVLWSVSNPWLLTDREIRAVRLKVVNYHDSLLPLHAGMHATSWAMLEGRTLHGVTWHEVDLGVDTGGCLAQLRVPVLDQDSVFDLNARCLDAACRLFVNLLNTPDLVLRGGQPQRGERSYFGARHRVANQCALDAVDSSGHWLRLLRSHDFGRALNPLGLPKVQLLPGRWLVVQKLEVVPELPVATGQWRWEDEQSLLVGVADATLRATRLKLLDGRDAFRTRLTEEWALLSEGALHNASTELQNQVSHLHRRICLHEAHWREVLSQLLPAIEGSRLLPVSSPSRVMRLSRFMQALQQAPAASRQLWAVGAVLLHAMRSRTQPHGQVGLVCDLQGASGSGLFASVVPAVLPDLGAMSWKDWLSACQESISLARSRQTFPLDLLCRMRMEDVPVSLPNQWPMALNLSGLVTEPEALAASRHVWHIPGAVNELTMVGPGLSALELAALDEQLAFLCQAALREAESDVRRLSLMNESDQSAWWVVGKRSAHRGALPVESVLARIKAQMSHSPGAPAVLEGGHTWSYETLVGVAEGLACRLYAAGVREGHLVGLHMSRGAQAIASMLAVWQLGAAWLPLDPEQPMPRLQQMVAQARPVVVLSQSASSLALGASEVPVIEVGKHSGAPPVQEGLPFVPIKPESVAYCIFTSGSTGQPKGVLVEHAALWNHLSSMIDVYRVCELSRGLWSASIGFDVAIEQIFPVLIQGGTVHIRPADLFDSIAGFDDHVRVVALTHLALPTAIWHAWVSHLEATDQRVPQALEVIGVGTERVDAKALAQWWALGGQHARFFQGYGPTETTITCTVHEVTRHEPPDARSDVPIGRPLPNVAIAVVDALGQPVPAGVEGEIYVAGAGLARGYVNQPELTAERFIDFSPRGMALTRAYRTGDRAHVDALGRLVFIGRTDGQIKLNGHRVELGEIEGVVRQFEHVIDALVLLHAMPDGRSCLVGHVVSTPSDGLQPERLRELCALGLPVYMQPVQWFVHACWPLNINGKIDRKALPAPQAAQTVESPAVPEPEACSDETVWLVAEAFRSVLGHSLIGLDSSFFDLGGDSLGAMRLLGRLQSNLGVRLGFGDLLAAPSIRMLSAAVRDGGGQAGPRVVRLKEGTGVPIWLLAGVFLYQDLARALATDQPVYVAFLPIEEALLRSDGCLPEVHEIAGRYVELILKRTPQGPYVIGGFSVGGAIAHAVAAQLVGKGHRVSLLVILDTTLPSHRLRIWHWRKWSQRWHAWWRQRKHAEETAVRRDRGDGAVAGPPADALDTQRMRQRRDLEYGRILRAYEATAEPYLGDAVVYRTTGEDQHRLKSAGLGFASLLSVGWSECPVLADHVSLMKEPAASLVAADLSKRLTQTCACPESQPSLQRA